MMTTYMMKLPDVGEGIAEAELVEWRVSIGDSVKVDDPLADVMTDKVSVEISSPVSGVISFLAGVPGDVLAVGSDFVGVELYPADSTRSMAKVEIVESDLLDESAPNDLVVAQGSSSHLTAAIEKQVETSQIKSAKDVTRRQDGRFGLDDPMQNEMNQLEITEKIRIIGLRRKIAEKMMISASRIPHFSYVEEVDVTAIEEVRAILNAKAIKRGKLTLLPFLMRAIEIAVKDYPQLNATLDENAEILTTYAAMHIGVATQTPNGLMVPVVRNVSNLDLWQIAGEVSRVAELARKGTATRDDLSGSTITISSLGVLGGLATTPIINYPEVSIIGVNKMQTRAVWNGQAFVPRNMMNLSSSFDHRVVDGSVAASFIQRIKALVEQPKLLVDERSIS
jgi:2-oxoisovalerate dehydrogenase E2 component (dihydrolipoyl transacylase)